MPKLKNAPLQEVIFEILWDIDYDEKGIHHDPDFDLGQGIFAKAIEAEFPLIKRTIPEELLNRIYPIPVYQFWKGENIWPVVQIGPGMLAVNDTEKNYDWELNFQSLIKNSITTLEKSYNKSLSYKRVSLRYIDAISINPDIDIVNFINKNFKVTLQNNYDTIGKLQNINFNQTFKIDENTLLNFSITNGFNNKTKPAIIWQTQIYTDSKLNLNDLLIWVNKAHTCASKTFENTLNNEFYSSFR